MGNPTAASSDHPDNSSEVAATTAGPLAANRRIVHALSFEIEDWFHLEGLPTSNDPSRWDALPSLVEKYTGQILETLARHRERATFFMLGWVCQRYPHMAAEISAAGHELAIHSFWHRRCDRLARGELYRDLKQSIDLVEQQGGQKVLGFRAPGGSITPGSEWVFDVLLDLGLKYDSSLPAAWTSPAGFRTSVGCGPFGGTPSGRTIAELPISRQKLGPWSWAFASGPGLRLLPGRLLRRGFRQHERDGQPAVLSLHPRDFAADCPRARVPWPWRFKHHTGLKTTQKKLESLISRYRFDTCAAVLGLQAAQRERGSRAA